MKCHYKISAERMKICTFVGFESYNCNKTGENFKKILQFMLPTSNN